MTDYVTRQKIFRRRTVGFWIFYVLMLAAFGAGLYFGLGRLEEWLKDFEASQPETECQNIFDDLFSHPDWEALYDLAGLEDTPFESRDSFAAYMTQRTGDASFEYHETSAGLSGDRKYIVTQGGEKIAVFTLTRGAEADSGIPVWELGGLEFFFSRSQGVTVCTGMDVTVCINGVPLGEEYTIRTLTTDAENYLPEGIHGKRLRWQYVPELLMAPEVTALDEAGDPVELFYDEATATYAQRFSEQAISPEQTDTVVAAAKVYCRYMIGDTGKTTLKKHFDASSEIYKTITKSDTWMQSYSGFDFSEYTLSGYYRYSSGLYSVRLTMTLNVRRTNGTVKEYPLDATFFLEYTDGTWLVREMTNVDVQQETELVRLTYILPDGSRESRMVGVRETRITPPEVAAPAGQEFIGWYQLQTDAAGNSSYRLAFMPDETGTVYLPEDISLPPMTLHPLFETKEE